MSKRCSSFLDLPREVIKKQRITRSQLKQAQDDFVDLIMRNLLHSEQIVRMFEKVDDIEGLRQQDVYQLLNESHGIDAFITLLSAIQSMSQDEDYEPIVHIPTNVLLRPLLWGEAFFPLIYHVSNFARVRMPDLAVEVYKMHETEHKSPEQSLVAFTQFINSDTHIEYWTTGYNASAEALSFMIKYGNPDIGIQVLDRFLMYPTQYDFDFQFITDVFSQIHNEDSISYLVRVIHHPYFQSDIIRITTLLDGANEWSVKVILSHFNVLRYHHIDYIIRRYKKFNLKFIAHALTREAVLSHIALVPLDELEVGNYMDFVRKEHEGERFTVYAVSVTNVLEEIGSRIQQYLDAGLPKDVITINLSFEFMTCYPKLQPLLEKKLAQIVKAHEED